MTENIANNSIYNGFKLAAENLDINVPLLNNLNVFPVPDQDTGSNMAISMSEVASVLNMQMSIGEMFDAAANELLQKGKGNSGTILTLFFQGMAETIGSNELTGTLLAKAFNNGAMKAAQGISDPMDGTILTIAQKAAEEGMAFKSEIHSVTEVMKRMTEEAYSVLPLTALQNPTCAKYEVIDAGALGFCMIMDGFLAAFEGIEQCQRKYDEIKGIATKVEAQELVYNFCTEFVIDKSSNRGAVDILRHQLADIGDCIIPAEMGDKLKMHIHTSKPEAVFFIASLCGPIVRTKVDNMLAQTRCGLDSEDIFLCKGELTRDALLSMNHKNVFIDSEDRSDFLAFAEEHASAGTKLCLYTSAVVAGKTQEMFPVIRFFTSDDDLLTYLFSME